MVARSIGTSCPTATIGADACPRAACAPRGGDPWEVSTPRRTTANAMTAMLSTALAMTHHCGFRISLAPDVCAAPDGLLHWDAAVGPGQRNASQRHIAAVQGFQIVAVHPMQPGPERLRTLVETIVQLLPLLAQTHQDAAAVAGVLGPLGKFALQQPVTLPAGGGQSDA